MFLKLICVASKSEYGVRITKDLGLSRAPVFARPLMFYKIAVKQT